MIFYLEKSKDLFSSTFSYLEASTYPNVLISPFLSLLAVIMVDVFVAFLLVLFLLFLISASYPGIEYYLH